MMSGFKINVYDCVLNREWIPGKDTFMCMLPHTFSHTPILAYHLICTGTRGISTAATAVSQRVRFPCHHHPQGPHQGNDPTSNQHTGTLSPNSPMPSCRYQDTTRYFQPITLTHLLKIHDAHRGSSAASVKLKPIQ